ncbi:MAG: multidrug resistance protein [Chitinophagales bacterium]|nr:MAG: multidrug resistance protein [Chitinophagales bacterium]
MNISSISINRPVLATVISIVIVLFGAVGFSYLGVREYPSVDPPIVTVTTNYTGANADIIESQITEPLEESINGIAGIASLTSTSSDGRSTIRVEFELGMDMDAAANDVRDRVSRAVRNLPPDADPPIIVKSDANAETILSITVSSDKRTLLQLTDIGINIFKERLQTIPGVSEIRIWGEKKYAMRLEMDPLKIAAYGLTPLDVRNALLAQNVELPSGRIEGYEKEMVVRTFGRLTTEEDFNNMIIAEKNNTLIRFRDIGQARLAPENERTLLRGDGGVPMIGVALTPQPGANYIDIVDEAYKRVNQIKKELPEDIRLGVALDTTVTIRKAIKEVEETILIAFLLVVLVIFLFLRDWRTTLIPVVAIPISLIGSFFIMYLAGFSINILTLLAIVLATGIVVDDAIVVMENIYSKIEKGMSPMEAAHQGSAEIIFAIISTTITLVAVFLPIIFLEGLTGRLFREFGIVVAGAVIISAVVSLTLTPMMSSRLLRHKTRPGRFYQASEQFFNAMVNGYQNALRRFMQYRWIALLIMLVSGFIIYLMMQLLPRELAPMEDKSRLRIMCTAPEGTSFEKMDAFTMELVKLTDTLPEKESLLSVTSPGFGASVSTNTSFIRLTLVPPDQRTKSQEQLARELNTRLRQYNFARAFVVQDQTIATGGGLRGLPVQYVLQAPNLDKLRATLPAFLEEARKSPVFEAIDYDLRFNKPELKLQIHREKAREMGVEVRDIAETLQLLFSGQRFGFFILNGKQYQVIGQAGRENRNEIQDIAAVTVRNKQGIPVRLDNLVTMEEESSPPQLYRYNRYVSATISAQPAKGYTLGQGIEEMDRIADKLLDETFSTSLAGTSKDFAESSSTLLFAFLFALILIFLALSAQFESFLDPLTIMLTVPLALAGALLTLWIFGHSLNIFSQIGIIVLIGIVTKNGILIVEFANQRQLRGLSVTDAAMEAAAQRFRPIVMTSLSTTLGAVPIAFALGGAATSRIPMGVAIIGGILFSLGLTLFVIPALYVYVEQFSKWLKKALWHLSRSCIGCHTSFSRSENVTPAIGAIHILPASSNSPNAHI